MEQLGQYISIFGTILGVAGLLSGGVFFLKFTATKANLDGKDETIETLEKSRNAYRDSNADLERTVATLHGENMTLRDIATQTPQIIELTKAVTNLTKNIDSASTKQMSILTKILNKQPNQKDRNASHE